MNIFLRHPWRVFIIVLLFIIFLGRYEYKMPKRNFADFNVYYYTAKKLIHRENIYDQAAYKQDNVANFKYPPIVALLFYPFGWLNENSAAVLWFFLNFVIVIFMFYWLSEIIFDREFSRKGRNWIYFLSSLFCLRFFMYNFDEGQVNFIMMAGVVFCLWLLERSKRFYSAVALGFSSLVKYMAIILVPYLFFKKRFKLVIYFTLAVFAISFIPAVFLGFKYNAFLQYSFLPHLFKTSLDFGSLSTHENQSLFAFAIRYFSSFSKYGINVIALNKFYLGIVIGGMCVFMYMLILFASNRTRNLGRFAGVVDYAMLFVCIPLFNPNGWVHAFIFLLFPYMVCLYYLFKLNSRDIFVKIMAAISAVSGSWPNQLFIRTIKDSTEVYSLLTFSALAIFAALFKIKFFS